MTSAADVRYDRSECFGSANLIVNQGVANIFHKTVKLLRILGVFEENREILLGRRRVHGLANLFQFPGNSSVSDPAPNLEKM